MDNPSNAITEALEKLDYVTAERLIRANTVAHILDVPDAVSRTTVPLGYVLAPGETNLFLAKLLVENGANPNIRLQFHNTWDDASQSPMEMLLALFEEALNLNEDQNQTIRGLHNQEVHSPTKCREQLLELLDFFLAHRGNPNVLTSRGRATLYHTSLAQTDPDMDVVTRLCDAGGDLNTSNIHGTTAFMDLVKHARGDLALTILIEIENRQTNAKELTLNVENERNETALWYACYSGSPRMAVELLKRGADASFCDKGVHAKMFMVDEHVNVPPILAPLIRTSYPHKIFTSVGICPSNWNIPLMNKVISYSISLILDTLPANICFPPEAIYSLKELTHRLTYVKKNDLYQCGIDASKVPVLMFGQLSAGLEQLCVRVIMERVMRRPPNAQFNPRRALIEGISIERLVTDKLRLPSLLVPRFNIEMARLEMGFSLFLGKASMHCECDCDNLSDDETVSNSSNSDDDLFGTDIRD